MIKDFAAYILNEGTIFSDQMGRKTDPRFDVTNHLRSIQEFYGYLIDFKEDLLDHITGNTVYEWDITYNPDHTYYYTTFNIATKLIMEPIDSKRKDIITGEDQVKILDMISSIAEKYAEHDDIEIEAKITTHYQIKIDIRSR